MHEPHAMPPGSETPPTSPPPPGDSAGMPPDSPEDADAMHRDSETRSSPPGLLLVVSGPSGVGKTTIVRRVLERFDGVFSVSATTRPRTAVETDGVDYHFLDEPTFQTWIDEDRFLEYAQVFGRSWYGTPRKEIESRRAEGRLVALDIDVQGARQVKTHRPDAFGLFILPPSEAVLHKRLVDRKREPPEVIERRFAEAKSEIAAARSSDVYDALVVNDDLERATAELHTLIERRLQTLRNG